jgi:hypothetical protein
VSAKRNADEQKGRSPSFQFYPRQFAGDDQVMAMDLDTIGAHALLMCAAAASPERCRIDADEHAIRIRLRNPSDQDWERMKRQLLKGAWKLSEDGQFWEQDGLRRTFCNQETYRALQQKKANVRWSRARAGTMPDVCRGDAERMPQTCSSSSSSPSGSIAPNSGADQSEEPYPAGNSEEAAQIVCGHLGLSGTTNWRAVRDQIDLRVKAGDSLQASGDAIERAHASWMKADIEPAFRKGVEKWLNSGEWKQWDKAAAKVERIDGWERTWCDRLDIDMAGKTVEQIRQEIAEKRAAADAQPAKDGAR